MPLLVTQLSDGLSNDISKYGDVKVNEELQEGVANINRNGIKFLYQNES